MVKEYLELDELTQIDCVECYTTQNVILPLLSTKYKTFTSTDYVLRNEVSIHCMNRYYDLHDHIAIKLEANGSK